VFTASRILHSFAIVDSTERELLIVVEEGKALFEDFGYFIALFSCHQFDTTFSLFLLAVDNLKLNFPIEKDK
jgi:hypothetical protein